ncbi:MAG: thiolase family protein [Myxococcota bacterium]
MKEAFIIDGVRTAVGSFQGGLSPFSSGQLGGMVVKELVKRTGVNPEAIDECIMGNVLTGGMGQAPARQAAIYGGLPTKVECLTINKVCGSGLKAAMLAEQAIKSGDAEVIIAGGQESMTNSPYALTKARSGYRMGNGEIVDLMINDGLWDPYQNGHMGNFADKCAKEKGFSREEQDKFAIESYRRAQRATNEGLFRSEVMPVEIPQKKGEPMIFDKDEDAFKLKEDKVPTLKPAFNKDGTVTAANASSINDGAAATLIVSGEAAKKLGLKPQFKIIAQASYAEPPEWFTIAPAGAIKKALKKAGMTKGDIDLWEINEAFAVVTLYAMREIGIDHSIVNVHGGGCSIGHPIGASGTRILVTLMNAMKHRNASAGLATLCIGGGEGAALIIERVR